MIGKGNMGSKSVNVVTKVRRIKEKEIHGESSKGGFDKLYGPVHSILVGKDTH